MTQGQIRILLVGHCGPDSYALRSAIGSMVPGALVEFAADDAALGRGLESASLLLINRVLDGDYQVRQGVDLIRSLGESGRRVRTMLVSNFPESQSQAVAAGALPGFGKKDMYAEETRRRIRSAVGLE